MERTYHEVNSEPHSVEEDSIPRPRRSYDEDEAPLSARGVHLASLAEKKRLWWRNAIINALFIASWYLFSTMLSVYNKWMFSPDRFGFPAPLFVTTNHFFIQFGLASILRFGWPKTFRPRENPSREDYAKKAVPTAMATGIDIGLSNLSLKTITLSFFTMCKSSSLIFVLLFAFVFRLESFSWHLVGVIFLIFSGVILMVATEAQFVLEGLILVLSASALGGLRWSLTQVLLKSKRMGFDNPAATIFWLAPSMGITLGIISAVLEDWPSIFRSKFFDGAWTTFGTLFFLVSPGVIAFCMVLSEFYILQRAGVVPMSIAGIAKEVSTIIISSWIFGDKLKLINGVGVAITVCGIGLFTHHKYRKSLESTVPLDAHGNPILDDFENENMIDGVGYGGQTEETIRLTSTRDEDLDVALDDEENDGNARRLYTSEQSGGGSRPKAPEFQWESGDNGEAHDDRRPVQPTNGIFPPEVQKAWNG